MISHCTLDDDVVLYALGELEGERREHLEAHVELCPECQKRIQQYRQVKRQLQTVRVLQENDLQRDALKRRILAETSGPPVEPARSKQRVVWRWQPALAIVLMLAIGVALASTSDVAGHFPFSQYIGFAPTEEHLNNDAHADATPDFATSSYRELLEQLDTGAPVPTGWDVPAELPLGLYRVDSFVTERGSVAHYFLSREHGIEVTVNLEDRAASRSQLTGRDVIVVPVQGVDVLVDRRASGHVNSLLWIDGDTLITVLIVRAFGGYVVSPEEFLPVADAIIRGRAPDGVGEERE